MGNPLLPPASVVASWPSPNYVDPVTTGPALLIWSIVCIVLCVVLCVVLSALRIYSRVYITKGYGTDDSIALFGAFCTILFVLSGVYNCYVLNMDRHVWDLPKSQLPVILMTGWIGQWFYVGAACSIKVSILLFYKRLSVSFTRMFLMATYFGIAYNACCVVGGFLTLMLTCQPYNAYWDVLDTAWTSTHDYKCRDLNVTVLIAGMIWIVGDLYSAVVPIFLLRYMVTSSRRKLALYALFGLSFFAVAAGVVRAVITSSLQTSYDFTWILSSSYIWADLELFLGFFAASTPSFVPLVKKCLIEPLRARSSYPSDELEAQVVRIPDKVKLKTWPDLSLSMVTSSSILSQHGSEHNLSESNITSQAFITSALGDENRQTDDDTFHSRSTLPTTEQGRNTSPMTEVHEELTYPNHATAMS